MLRLYLCLFMIISGTACSMGGIVKISEPSVGNSENKAHFKNGIIYKNDISLSVKPVNIGSGLLTIGPLIFPVIPIGISGKYEREEELFRLFVLFDTKESNYILNPREVILNIDGKSYSPIGASDLITNTRPAREHHRSIPGHDWVCDSSDQITQVLLANIIKVQKGCVLLEYEVETQDPRKEFYVEINGLSMAGTKVPIEPIYFKSSFKGVFFLLM